MDKPQRRILPLASALLLSLAGAVAEAGPSARIWRVCVTDLSVPPLLNNDAANPGTIEKLMVDAGRQVGLSVLLLRFPIKRCAALLDSGGADATLAAPTEANRERLQFPRKAGGGVDESKRLVRVNLVWVRRADAPFDWTGQALTGGTPERTLVATRMSMHAAIEPLVARGFKVDATAISTKQLLMKVALKRTDLAVGLQEEVEAALQDPALAQLVVMPRAFFTGDFYAVGKKIATPATQESLDAWWTAIGKLRAASEPAVKTQR